MVSVKLFLSVNLVTEKTQLQDDLFFLVPRRTIASCSAVDLRFVLTGSRIWLGLVGGGWLNIYSFSSLVVLGAEEKEWHGGWREAGKGGPLQWAGKMYWAWCAESQYDG